MTDKIKRGDLLPAWKATLFDGATAVDLTAASSIRVLFIRPGGSPRTITGVTGTALGVVTVPWDPTDTATTGDLLAEVEVTWPGSKPQTFPPDDYIVTRIYQDLG